MPYTIKWKDHGNIMTFSGPLRGKKLIEANILVLQNPLMDQIEYQIVDLLGVTEVEVRREDVKALAEMDSKMSQRRPNVRIAIVTDQKVLIGLSRMYELYGFESKWETQTFDDEKSAREWATAK